MNEEQNEKKCSAHTFLKTKPSANKNIKKLTEPFMLGGIAYTYIALQLKVSRCK